MPSVNNENFKSTVNIPAVLKGTFLTLAISLLLSITAGTFYHFSSVSEQTLPWGASIILAASTFSGALVAGKAAGSKGLYHGLTVGLLFFVAVWLFSGILPGAALVHIVYKLFITSGAGILGGTIGVGLS